MYLKKRFLLNEIFKIIQIFEKNKNNCNKYNFNGITCNTVHIDVTFFPESYESDLKTFFL